MRTTQVLAAAALVAGSMLGTATGTATAAEAPGPTVQWVNGNVIVSATDHDVATVTGKYRCFGGNDDQTHLWVSVKQGPQVNTTDHSSSSWADSWYDTNWNSDPVTHAPLTTLVCDGTWQVTRATVKRVASVPWVPGRTWGQLQDGSALIQFCAFDSSGSEETGSASVYQMGTVRVPAN